MENYEMVVARFKENINWINELDKKFLKIKIYNKFFHNEENPLYNETGRESHTYLHHIYYNYENLSDYTIFTQANPFDHSPQFIYEIKNIIEKKEKIDFHSFVTFFGQKSIICNLDGYPHHPTLNLQRGMSLIFPESNINSLEFYPGAILMVSKQNILKRSKEFYKKCLDLSCDKEWKDSYGNYSCGYFFERTWKYIFNSDLK